MGAPGPSEPCKGLPNGRVREGRAEGCAVPVLYLILRFLEDLAVSGGSDPA
jgi:hypothetical protein